MSALDGDAVDSVVRQMLDAIRNAHMLMVLGEPHRAIVYVREARGAHERLGVLFNGNSANEALAGRILYDVIGHRMESLSALARECLQQPLPQEEVVALVAKPLEQSRTGVE